MQNNNYKKFKNFRVKCLGCGGKKLSKILDFGLHSFADRFIKSKDIKKKDPFYPLVLDLCKRCKFIQTKYITNPKDRYYNYDYSYTSSNSKYSINHWFNYSHFLDKKFGIKDKKILEIGSNDGLLSNYFRNLGGIVTCLDASPLMSRIAKKKGLLTINAIFSLHTSQKIKKRISKQDFVVANNVFNHSDDPSDFLKGVKNILKKNGIFIFEQPYFLKTLKTKRFDQVYHEHISYFTVHNLENLLKKNGFQLLGLYNNDYHGGSLRTIAINSKNFKSKNYKIVNNFKKTEKKLKIFNILFYKKYMKFIINKKNKILKQIYILKKKNYTIYGVGAGAKTNTYLTFNNLNFKNIDGITESSSFKIGKYTPLTRIKIYRDNKIKNLKKVACIIFSWNIENILKKKIKLINKNVKFIKT